jgi:hypothetical protein
MGVPRHELLWLRIEKTKWFGFVLIAPVLLA